MLRPYRLAGTNGGPGEGQGGSGYNQSRCVWMVGCEGGRMAGNDSELTAEDLREMVRMLDLIPIPERVMPQVLDAVREQRAAVRRFAESGVEVDETLTAQPYHLEEEMS